MSDLRLRLQHLRPARLRPLPAAGVASPTDVLASALPGREVVGAQGAYQLVEEIWPLDFRYGSRPLADWLACSPLVAARMARRPELASIDLDTLAFMDIETSGLAGGAGTLAFLIGVGWFEGDRFILRQYFLRRPAEERPMLVALAADLAARAGWVTFNGRVFDVPLLEMRFTVNRQRHVAEVLAGRPHLDLLLPARRLYHGRLSSCSLIELERQVLGLVRAADDVPGREIPFWYQAYLRNGASQELRRVFHHNRQDVLSLVMLAAHLVGTFAASFTLGGGRSLELKAEAEQGIVADELGGPSASDCLRLAAWHGEDGRLAEAEAAYRVALAGQLSAEERRLALGQLAALLKRQGRRFEAAPLWVEQAELWLADPQPCVELAKLYEWHVPNIASAMRWTKRAWGAAENLPRGRYRSQTMAELKHRLERLQSKERRLKAGG